MNSLAACNPCRLRIFDRSVGSTYQIGCSPGSIAGRRPSGFDTEGLITPLAVADDAAEHHFFAKAVLDPASLQWITADGEIVEEDWDVANTNTTLYEYRATAEVVAGVLVISDPVCGDFEPDPCSLASDISP